MVQISFVQKTLQVKFHKFSLEAEVSIYQHFSKSVWVKFPGFRSGSDTCHTCNMTDDEKQTSSVRVGDLEHVTN